MSKNQRPPVKDGRPYRLQRRAQSPSARRRNIQLRNTGGKARILLLSIGSIILNLPKESSSRNHSNSLHSAPVSSPLTTPSPLPSKSLVQPSTSHQYHPPYPAAVKNSQPSTTISKPPSPPALAPAFTSRERPAPAKRPRCAKWSLSLMRVSRLRSWMTSFLWKSMG